MAHLLHHGTEDFMLHSYTITDNEVIVDKKKFLSFLTSIGIPTTVHEGIIDDIKTELLP